MHLPDLIRLIEGHAAEIVAELSGDLRHNARTSYMRRVNEEEFNRRAQDLYANLTRWITAQREDEVRRAYRDLGRARREEGVPASDLMYALVLAKRHLLDFIGRNAAIESPLELYQEGELLDMINRFFDEAAYHAITGYEAGQAGQAEERLARLASQSA